MLTHMTLRKPPNPADLSSGFPYRAVWEELEDSWEILDLTSERIKLIEFRFAAARLIGAAPHLCITKEDIDGVLRPLSLDPGRQQHLTLHFYYIAGAYLSREHQKMMNSGPNGVRQRLGYVSKAAKELNSALRLLRVPEPMALLQMTRSIAPHTIRPKEDFNLGELLAVSCDLALTADYLIENIPRLPRGAKVDNLRDRFIWTAAWAFQQWTGIEVRAPQTDTCGRNPRLEGVEGSVFLSYLRLVSPKVKIGTVVRVLAERRRIPTDEPAL
jgi:hypothetical protein